jgi:ribosomal protein L11 methyltransferase
MSDSDSDACVAARLRADEKTVLRIADALGEILDPETVAVAAFETPPDWTLEIDFRVCPDQNMLRDLVTRIAGAELAAGLVFSTVSARDWVKASLEGLKPVAAGRFVVHGAHDQARVAPNRIGIEIEAALAFGTGHHGTTRGCLLALDALAKKKHPRRILDVGTGTGVLAIAAARALRELVLATDIDPRAVVTARDNAVRNRAGALIATLRAPGLAAHRIRIGAPYDLIFANILAGPLKGFAATAAKRLAPGGHIVLSGLLPAHANMIISAYRAQGLILRQHFLLEGWVTLVMARGRKRRPGH